MHDAPDSSLKRDHRLIVGALIVVIALCWAWIVPMARDMYTTMTGSSAWMMTNRWDFAPWKRAHLDGFRSSPQCSAAQVTPEGSGGFRIGLDHGLHCLGCCWALMLLLFVGGVMNLWCIAALTMFVLLEKLTPLGSRGSRLSGALIVTSGVWYLV